METGMRKIILMIFLAVASNSVMAAWSKVTDNEEAIIYADLSTVSKSGNLVKMWDLTDLRKKNPGDNYLSSKTQHEFDCKEKKSRVLNFSTFSGQMSSGNSLNTSNRVHDWLPVKPGGVAGELWAAACGKAK